jgi:hypothetical protein
MAFERLRHQWSEISLEKKLAMFVAPVFVAVMSGIIVSFATGAFRTSNDSQPPAPGSASTVEAAGGLEVVDVGVTSGVPANDPGDPAVPPVIDVTVRNTGREVSVITGASLRVRELAWIGVCEGGAGLDPSVEYDVILPASADAGEVVEADVSQQVPANTADRFTLRLYTPEENRGDGTRLYQLDVELEHDATARPLEAGTVVVAVPFDPDSNLLSVASELPEEEQPADLRACYDANKARFLDFLELEGERSPELTAELAD